ncbi:MAG: bifunctional DedA family/phosphatase PAP2 family protein [Acidobacteria bacterium]|nr:bifunctional DedA family/phosphatase PAP2 family protein [Acidobacteriota bacterium]
MDALLQRVSQLGHWGYVVIFVAATLESAAFLGLAIPGETLVLLTGFLASRGLLDIGDLIVVVSAGAVLGDSIGYELGRRLGREALIRYGRWIGLRSQHLDRVDTFFGRHGGKTIFLGRFIGFLRALAPFVAGSARMRYREFLPYNVAGGILWSVTFVLLGYLLGASWRHAEQWIGRASAVLGIVLVVVFALSALGTWIVRHERDVKDWWARAQEHRRIVYLRRRYATELAFLQARLSPEAYLGLHLTVGMLAFVSLAWLFGAIAEDVVTGDPLTQIDVQLNEWLHAHATSGWTTSMRRISLLGSGRVVTALVVSVALVLIVRRCWDWLLVLLLAVPGGAVLNLLLKAAFRRERPRFDNPFVTLNSYSFPSGHAMAATLFFGTLGVFAVRGLPSWRWRVLAVLGALLLILLVGFSRVYLGAHYLSDVLAAVAAGFAWLTLCLTAVHTLKRRRKTRRSRGGVRLNRPL